MRSPATQILETALALHRAPGERFRLRERPLPPGLVSVLEVASGSPQALANAARELGEEQDGVLEAARFYLEQILFAAPDADAYRVLGVAADAPNELIRIHHRWLQRWLHPDRAQAGDASVYATRVNQAWAALRTPELRHQYDVRLAEARLAGATAPLPTATVRHWEGEDVAPAYGRRSRWLLGAALAACAVLAVLIVRHEQGPQPWEPAQDVAAVEDARPIVQPAMQDRDLGILTEALASATAPPEAVAATAAPTREAIEAPVAELPPAAPHEEAPKALVISQAGASEPLVRSHVGAAEAATPLLPPEPVPARAAPTPREIAQSPKIPLVGAAEAATPKPAQLPAALAVTPPAPKPPTLLLDRMQKAEQRVAQLTAYLAAQPGAAPLWNDLQTAQEAERIRNRIAADNGTALELTRPNWQLQRDNATLSVDYQCNSCRVRKGRIDVQLVWREGLWLVRGIGLAPAA